jgi:hypothetical protein
MAGAAECSVMVTTVLSDWQDGMLISIRLPGATIHAWQPARKGKGAGVY